MPNDLLDPKIGLLGVLEPKASESFLPKATTLSSDTTGETGLDTLFKQPTLDSLIKDNLAPKNTKPELLMPEAYFTNLKSAKSKLEKSKNPAVKRFLKEELEDSLVDSDFLRNMVGYLLGA
jgi:hypothetical protein